MNELTTSEVVSAILRKLKQKDHKRLWPQVELLLVRIHNAHLAFIEESDIEDYQEDDAFEAVYSEVLNCLPDEEDDDLAVASLINAYFEGLDDLE